MSLFNCPVEHKKKPVSVHPWSTTIKYKYSNKIIRAHNSIKNAQIYPKSYMKHERVPYKGRTTFTVIGTMVAKDFIYCVQLVKGMYKYRWKNFGCPIIQGVTSAEWPNVLFKLKVRFGNLVGCLKSPVAVLLNDIFIGGEAELKDLIETKYIYHIVLNYKKECENQFVNFVKASGRPCAYLHISIDDVPIGTLTFMLYSDVVPVTCDNFLRLCQAKKGGYSGTPIHRIVKYGWIQCGGFGLNDTHMDCENFIVPHDKRGVLGMANAGRHVDCSTQFFVLLQPLDWLKYRFVAFGQLIDGEETLQKIEQVATFYESPTANVIIYQAGILNLECQRIAVNKNVCAYIDEHIENLVTVGEIFYQMLLEKVYLEIEFRILQKLEFAELEEEINPEAVDEEETKIRQTQRFRRKKQDVQEKNPSAPTVIPKRQSVNQSAPSPEGKLEENENNNFDVEDYEPEEYMYANVEPSESSDKALRPYYIEPTDVPYPGETDSNYDLKRFLRGDYCLEADLEPHPRKTSKMVQKTEQFVKISMLSEIMTSCNYFKFDDEKSSTSSSSDEMNSDEERELRTYLQVHGEVVSFSGRTINSMARRGAKMFPLLDLRSCEYFTDEEVRLMRLAKQVLKTRQKKLAKQVLKTWQKKKVSISVEQKQVCNKIKRRQTGFVLPSHLAAIEQSETDVDENKSRLAKQVLKTWQKKKVSISVEQKQVCNKIKRRQTGFVLPSHLAAIEQSETDVDENKSSKVRIAPNSLTSTRETVTRHVSHRDSDNNAQQIRPSVLVRLYDEMTADSDEAVPTLKNFRPSSELKNKKNNLFLTITSVEGLKNTSLRKDDNYLRQVAAPDSQAKLIKAQHGDKAVRKMSTDYVNTIHQMEKIQDKTLRTMEYSKVRRGLSVTDYHKRNQLHAQEKKNKEETAPIIPTHRGLRLPGDTPLYGSREGLCKSQQMPHFK